MDIHSWGCHPTISAGVTYKKPTLKQPQGPQPGWWQKLGMSDPLDSPKSGVSKCPFPILTVHPDHSVQRTDGVEVGFLLPAFF